jgi:hypothetical protein
LPTLYSLCISSFFNAQSSINDNFAKLSESLYVAEKKAREDIEARARIRQTATRKQQEMKEVEFRNLAAAARDRNSALDEREAEPEEEEYVSVKISISTGVAVIFDFFLLQSAHECRGHRRTRSSRSDARGPEARARARGASRPCQEAQDGPWSRRRS